MILRSLKLNKQRKKQHDIYGLGTKSASALGLASIALEAHDMGKRCARRGKAQASADKFVSDNIGASKTKH